MLFVREQEQMRKNIEQLLDNDANCVAASDRLQQAINQRRTVTTGVVSIESSTAWFRRNGVQRNQTRFPPQQRVNQQQQAHFSPGHQFSSTDKMVLVIINETISKYSFRVFLFGLRNSFLVAEKLKY